MTIGTLGNAAATSLMPSELRRKSVLTRGIESDPVRTVSNSAFVSNKDLGRI